VEVRGARAGCARALAAAREAKGASAFLSTGTGGSQNLVLLGLRLAQAMADTSEGECQCLGHLPDRAGQGEKVSGSVQ
jgi:hypothetical protein